MKPVIALAVLLLISSVVGAGFVLARRVPTKAFWIIVGILLSGVMYVGFRLSDPVWVIPLLFAAPLILPILISRIPDVRCDPWVTFWFSSVAFGFTLLLAVLTFVFIGLTG